MSALSTGTYTCRCMYMTYMCTGIENVPAPGYLEVMLTESLLYKIK